MRRVSRVCLAFVVGWLGVWLAPHASAACHSFTVTGTTVTEGEKAKVTVRRDNTLDESSVQVRTANATAKAPPDYEATITRVEFDNESSRTIEIPTAEDKVGEDTETFQVKLGSGRGCRSFNTDYEYGPPATVTIKDDDERAAPAPVTAAPTEAPEPTRTPADTATPSSPSPSKTPTPTPTETPEETVTPLAAPVDDEDDGLDPWLVGVAIGAFVLAGVLALLLTRAMRTP